MQCYAEMFKDSTLRQPNPELSIKSPMLLFFVVVVVVVFFVFFVVFFTFFCLFKKKKKKKNNIKCSLKNKFKGLNVKSRFA